MEIHASVKLQEKEPEILASSSSFSFLFCPVNRVKYSYVVCTLDTAIGIMWRLYFTAVKEQCIFMHVLWTVMNLHVLTRNRFIDSTWEAVSHIHDDVNLWRLLSVLVPHLLLGLKLDHCQSHRTVLSF